ncbi:hypothetical protein D3C81_2177430 [compost metagenome]
MGQAGEQIMVQHHGLEVQVQHTILKHQLAIQVLWRLDSKIGLDAGPVAFIRIAGVERHAV